MKKVYVLQHSYEVGQDGEFDETKMIGVYSSREKAKEAIEKYKTLPGFKDYPISCFCIDEYEIDTGNWSEGFFKG